MLVFDCFNNVLSMILFVFLPFLVTLTKAQKVSLSVLGMAM